MAATAPSLETKSIPQGDLRLLDTDLAQRLLGSTIPARLAYVATDGTPRVVPTWFEWNGTEIVMANYLAGSAAGIRHPAARVAALRANPTLALIIDTETSPPQSITVRGRAEIDEVDGLAPEYISAAHRYLGDAASDMVVGMDQPGTIQARITVRPAWVGLLDFAERLPSPLGGVQEVASTPVTDEQVRDLAATAVPYSLVLLWWDDDRFKDGAAAIEAAHQRRMVTLRADGVIAILCPVGSDTLAGMAVLDASPVRARDIMADDPCVLAGMMRVDVHPCHSFPGDILPAPSTP